LKKTKKILVIVESIDVEDSSGSKVNVALIKNLQNIGYSIKVLHYTRRDIQLEGLNCISIKEFRYGYLFVLSRIQRILQRILKVNFSGFLENIFGHSFTFFNDSKSITKAINQQYSNEGLVITLSKGASFRPHHAMLALPKLHDKWMTYVHDPYPFHYYPRPYNWVEKGYEYKESFFRQVSEKAKYSAFPSLLLKEWMGSYFSNFLKTGFVIPHQNLKVESIKNNDDPSYFDKDKFTVLHAGNLMKQRSPEGLIAGFKLFLKNTPSAKEESSLLLLGNAAYYSEVLKKHQKELTQLYCSLGNVPYAVVNSIQEKVTVNVILESKSEISPFLPGKFPMCVFANKPILLLSPFYSETKRLLGDEYPYMCEVDAIETIAVKLEELYVLWKEKKNLLCLDRPDLENYLSKENLYNTIQKHCFND